jgi:serine/threonine protein kinase
MCGVSVSPYVEHAVLRTLGTGSFASVVMARCLCRGTLKRGAEAAALDHSVEVALKIHKWPRDENKHRGPWRSGKRVRRQTVMAEAQLLRDVAHANVIRLIDIRASTPGAQNDPTDTPTLVFPPADMDLSSFLRRARASASPPGDGGQGLPVAMARRLMAQLAGALAHVHSRGVLHRDVKPANCLIFCVAVFHGDLLGPSLVLADFGLARRLATPSDAQRRPLHWCLDAQRNPATPSGAQRRPRASMASMTTRVCTPWYRPPELWAETMDDHSIDVEKDDCHSAGTPYGTSLDVWSFGAVVYEVLSGSTLAERALTGAAMVKAVADVIGACPLALEYARCKQWTTWGAASKVPDASRRLPESGEQWDMVQRCLRWDPAARASMSSLQGCLWCLGAKDVCHRAEVTSGTSTLSAASAPTTIVAPPPGAPQEQVLEVGVGSSRTSHSKRVEEWFKPPPTTTNPNSGTQCACSGHCRVYKHRTDGECCCTELVVGTKYCITCNCVVAGCNRPKLKTDHCSFHRRVIAEAPLSVQLAVAAVPIAHLLMPCDVEDFCSMSVLLHDDLAMHVLVAAIKEPLATAALVAAWEKLPASYAGTDLRSAVVEAIKAVDGAPHVAQLDQLHRQGVGRQFGLIATAQNLGIIRKLPEPRCLRQEQETFKERVYHLGNALTPYAEPHDPEGCKCDAFLRAARAEEVYLATPTDQDAMIDLVDYGTVRAKAALQRIGAQSGALPFERDDADGYCIHFIVRKLVAARALRDPLAKHDWSTVNKSTLQAMSADANHNLKAMPDKWSASEIALFLTGRADWALFASAFACLWGEVASKLQTDDDQCRALKLVKSEAFRGAVQTFRQREGIAPHPCVVYNIATAKTAPAPRAAPSSDGPTGSQRASTPLKGKAMAAPMGQREAAGASTQRLKRKGKAAAAHQGRRWDEAGHCLFGCVGV